MATTQKKIPWTLITTNEAFEQRKITLSGPHFLIPAEEVAKLWQLEHERDKLKDILYRLVIKKDGTARIEAQELLKGGKK